MLNFNNKKTNNQHNFKKIQTNTSISKTLTTPNAGEDVEQQALSLIADENAKEYSHFGNRLSISYKAKHIFPHNLMVICLGIYLNKLKTGPQKPHTAFIHIITALSIIVKTQKQL